MIRLQSVTDQEIKVIRRKSNGGGIISMPIAVVQRGVDLEQTASEAEGKFDFDEAMFDQMVTNFRRNGRPVAFYFGHLTAAEKTTTPAAGFYLDLERRGELLIAEMDLGPEAFDLIVSREGFRGHSIEGGLEEKMITGEVLSGWSLTGGSITNVPALDVNAKLAASKNQSGQRTFTLSPAVVIRPARRKHMTRKERIKALRAEITGMAEDDARRDEVKAELAELEDRQSLEDRIDKLAASVTALADRPPKDDDDDDKGTSPEFVKLQRQMADEKRARLKLEQEVKARDVRDVCLSAIREGKSRAMFDGYDEDPIAYLQTYFGGSLDGLKRFAAQLKPEKQTENVGSGGSTIGTPSAVSASLKRFNKRVQEIRAEAQKAGRPIGVNEARSILETEDPDLYKTVVDGLYAG